MREHPTAPSLNSAWKGHASPRNRYGTLRPRRGVHDYVRLHEIRIRRTSVRRLAQLQHAYTPESGTTRIERLWGTLSEAARASLNESGLGKQYFFDAMVYASDVRNMLPTSANKLGGGERLQMRLWDYPTTCAPLFPSDLLDTITPRERRLIMRRISSSYLVSITKAQDTERCVYTTDLYLLQCTSVRRQVLRA